MMSIEYSGRICSRGSRAALLYQQKRLLSLWLLDHDRPKEVQPQSDVSHRDPAIAFALTKYDYRSTATSRPLSNFQIERPVSMVSTSGMTGLFKRATGRRSASKDLSDTSSIWSGKSTASFFRMPRLSKKSSDSSVRTSASRQADAVSISSKRVGSERGHGDGSSQMNSSRSLAGSIRRMPAPPSSFPSSARSVGQESRATTSSIYNVFQEDHLTTVKDIQQEILNVEAEAKRLMDAFNGLEVTTLAKTQRHRSRPSLKVAESGWAMEAESRSIRRINLADDAISMRSGNSVGTSHSLAVSAARSNFSRNTRSKGTLASPMAYSNPNSRPNSLHRKNSTSSVTSDKKARMLPPMPALPSYMKGASSSNLSLAKSAHPPMDTLPEGEKSVTGTINTVRLEPEDMETELEDIRKRREEVSSRYDTRLEYLRAKLKGAQLHEKLMRK